jgi:hypothetical protein
MSTFNLKYKNEIQQRLMAKIDAKVGHNNGYWSKINEFMCLIRFDVFYLKKLNQLIQIKLYFFFIYITT